MDFLSGDIVFILYVASLYLIAYVRYTTPDYIKNVLTAVVNSGNANILLKTGSSKKNFSEIFLSVNFYVSFSLFAAYSLSRFFDISVGGSFFLTMLSAGVFIFLAIYVNSAVNFLSYYIFEIPDIAKEINVNNKFFYRSAGIVLLIVNILISFSPVKEFAFYAGCFLLGVLYILRFFRIIKINFSKHGYYFYLFFYLCTVEIIPVLYFIKLLMLFGNTTN